MSLASLRECFSAPLEWIMTRSGAAQEYADALARLCCSSRGCSDMAAGLTTPADAAAERRGRLHRPSSDPGGPTNFGISLRMRGATGRATRPRTMCALPQSVSNLSRALLERAALLTAPAASTGCLRLWREFGDRPRRQVLRRLLTLDRASAVSDDVIAVARGSCAMW